ncbi:HK97 gp10 family phage protein [Sphingomonas cannabina]|uniref:HK97 gp10 family phage protein n=1 Tax=Sphingomonas cannabina TaxID=2899123 RepID=UPI001F3DA40B|nr:HK97 gp10 family phage protein [Sphingomonas cannabina]UIJ43722.1 HK97 gp10 family phage protein [Sphingomonas cannabina]
MARPIISVRVDGLKDLDASLGELPKATARNVLRRTGLAALVPFVDAVKRLAPVDEPSATPDRPAGKYRDSWHTGTRLNKNQARQARKEGKSFVEVYAGTDDPLGILLEYGTGEREQKSTGRETGNVDPHPHGRPAWDETSGQVLENVKYGLGAEIDKAAKRLARKAARKG